MLDSADRPTGPPLDALDDAHDSKADIIEAHTFLHKHPEIEDIDLLLPDTNGILRGKRIKRDALSKVYSEGIALPGSLFALTITGDTVEETGLGFDEGDADRLCWPVPGTLKVAPWQPRPSAQVFMSMFETDGQPFFADPRQVLTRVLEHFSELGLTPVVALELEFYLLDKQRDASGGPQPPLSPLTGLREQQTQVYGIAELDIYSDLLNEIEHVAEQQEVPVTSIVAEYAPGQYEINLQHVPDALAACDDVVFLKRLVKAVATQHGFDTTFMAKPYAEQAGNGLHVHISLLDEHGVNIFSDPNPLGNANLRHACAGLAASMTEGMGLFAPNANSYRRFQIEAYVPLNPSWGTNNRTLALRIPTGPANARRVEHRVAGADANPYLLLAALLAGMHHGLSQQLEPSAPVTGNAYQQLQSAPRLPATWQDALKALDSAQILPSYLGQDFWRVYRTSKWAEWRLFNRVISPLEHAWYMSAS
jgi:glutamine synthetase